MDLDTTLAAGGRPPRTTHDSFGLEQAARLGRYVLIKKLGAGGMGIVYSAYDPELDRKIAIKVLKRADGPTEERARLLREAKAMARLTHENVVTIHDVGTISDDAFIAMEYVEGGTIRTWLTASPRTTDEILRVFCDAARGLLAAHSAGIVHRDFKPDNVLVNRDGHAKVVDFGLARTSGVPDATVTEATDDRDCASSELSMTLTRSGAIMGSPAYMAPEQFLFGSADKQCDQFSFCVALWEALYDERPFHGSTLAELTRSVTHGERRLPRRLDRTVHTRVHRAIERGLARDPAERWPSMAELIHELAFDPGVVRSRRLSAAGFLVGLAGLVVLSASLISLLRERQERARALAAQIDDHTRSAREHLALARSTRAAFEERRQAAFDRFDNAHVTEGEALWAEVRELGSASDMSFTNAAQEIESVLTLDTSRDDLRDLLGDMLLERALLAEQSHDTRLERELIARLKLYDQDGSRAARWLAPAKLTVVTSPPGASLTIERYVENGLRQLLPGPANDLGASPIEAHELAQGSYRLTAALPDRPPVLYPFLAARDAAVSITLNIPAASAIPEGFIYVPPGPAPFGSTDEVMRKALDALPFHTVPLDAFLIARNETTFAEWIEFLETLSPEELTELNPKVESQGIAQQLDRLPDGTWRLTLGRTANSYSALEEQPIVYTTREKRKSHDWLKMPATGLTPPEIERYLQWLNSTRRLPGARLCSELEWERAARGADDRVFPHGYALSPDDGNIDTTYNKDPEGIGSDSVGSYPISRSPFGLDDMLGNAFEWTTSILNDDEFVARGGGFFFNELVARASNRAVLPASFRDTQGGFRVCVSYSETAG